MASNLTHARLREVLAYDPLTGIFTWRVSTSKRIRVGDVAGGQPNKRGYVRIRVDGELFFAHRLAWFWMKGEWPGLIDHRSTVGHQNWIKNLRDVTQKINAQNKRKATAKSRSGLLGVAYHAGRKKCWRAVINVDGKQVGLGGFTNKHKAHRAYIAAKRLYHEGCTL